MKTHLIVRLAAPAATAALALQLATAAQAKVPGPLVDTGWLAANKDKVVIIDVRKNVKSFTKEGHIPGARLLPWKDVRTTKMVHGVKIKGMLPPKEQFAALMHKLGVNNDSDIIIVTRGHNTPQVAFGTRLYWQLKYYGHDNAALLNGGLAAWEAAKKPLSHDAAAAAKPGNFTIRAERRDLLATTDDVAKAEKSGSGKFFDARSYDQYLGLFYKKKILTEGGHLPGAKFAPAAAFVAHKGPKTFASAKAIRATLKGLGADGKNDIAFCNTGHMASALWFTMHELGGDTSAKLYDGSMHAWTQTGHKATRYKAE
jgi:thiosulfate/3-mercaptopyruvate sulfurtransferase